jgi:hypothetical protein
MRESGMKNSKRIGVAVAVALGLVAVSAGWGAVRTGAVAPDDSGRIAFGMVGITAGQTARLNVAYIPPNIGDRPGRNPERVVRLQFLDEIGDVVAEQTVRLMPGHAAFLDYSNEGDTRIGNRQQIRGMVIEGGIDDPNIKNKGTLLGTVEVFDPESGKTQFVLGPTPHM